MFRDYLSTIAAGHRLKARTADTPAEREHWDGEAARFTVLAGVASEDEAEARREYRPTRAYQHEA